MSEVGKSSENTAPRIGSAEWFADLRRNPDARLNQKHAGIFLGGADNPVSERTMEDWRKTGKGPAYVKLGHRNVRYCVTALDQFLAERVRRNTLDRA